MGYDVSLLVDDVNEENVDEELICKICYGLLEKPRMMCAEGHNFCYECLFQWLSHNRTCPTCRGEIDEATPLIKNRLAERLIGEYVSFCPFRTPVGQCDWQGKLKDLSIHLERCTFATTPCRVSALCKVNLSHEKIIEHENKCPHLRTLCFRCGRLVRVSALQQHQRSSKCHRNRTILQQYLSLLEHTSYCMTSPSFRAGDEYDRHHPLSSFAGAPTTTPTTTTQRRVYSSGNITPGQDTEFESLPPPLSSSSSSEEEEDSDDSPASGNDGEAESSFFYSSSSDDAYESLHSERSRRHRRICNRADCQKMRNLLGHYTSCALSGATCTNGVCQHMTLLLSIHARYCQHPGICPVPCCTHWRSVATASQDLQRIPVLNPSYSGISSNLFDTTATPQQQSEAEEEYQQSTLFADAFDEEQRPHSAILTPDSQQQDY